MTIKDAIKMEEKTKKMLDDIISEIKRVSKTIELEGVTKICNNPNIVTVRFSDLKNDNWSASYYSAESQAEYVCTTLGNNAETATSFLKKIQEIIDKKYVTINNNRYYIRDEFIEVLKKYRG